ncbi:MAG: putative manganese-dependent inorganic diphosphatase [Nanobdellota archaeon]
MEKQKEIIISGHQHPDTDSIASTIAYADLLSKKGFKTLPIRLGELNKETRFVLKHFGLKAPKIKQNVYSRIKDLDYDRAITVKPNDTIGHVWNLMKEQDIQIVAVVDNVNRLLGVCTLSDIANAYMNVLEKNNLFSTNPDSSSILNLIDGEAILGELKNIDCSGKIVIGAMDSKKMKSYLKPHDIVIVGNREKNQLSALEEGADCLIITGKSPVPKSVIEKANEQSKTIIRTPYDTYQTVRLINQSVPITSIMREEILFFNKEEYVRTIKEKMSSTRYSSYPIVDASNKIVGFVSRYHILNPKKPQLVLVDHNEHSQSVTGIEEAEILEIIDHHRIGDVQSSEPIRFINDPVGSTATIIAERFFSEQVSLDPAIAGLLLSAIISDTVKLTSPTTTSRDNIMSLKLAEIAGVDIDEYAMEMFKAGTSIEGMSPKELFMQDFKQYEVSNLTIGIAQIPTMDFDSMEQMKKRVLAYMYEKAIAEKYDVLALVLTNVLEGNSEIIFSGESSDIMREAFNIPKEMNEKFLEGVISRKKQIIPIISKHIE